MALALAIPGACAPSGSEVPAPEPPGPPNPRTEVIEQHASQFAQELPVRAPGSNEEQVAASYLLGFLQQAGYPGRLDGVPVGDLVRATNVIATPPRGADPLYLVAVAYGTPPDQGRAAESIGTFLELARALSVRSLDHPVEFVALGAEFAEGDGGSGGRVLGSRALAALLAADSFEPQIIYLSPVLDGGGFHAQGPLGERLGATVAGAKTHWDPVAAAAAGVYRAQGFEVTLVDGSPQEVAATLLEFLSEASG